MEAVNREQRIHPISVLRVVATLSVFCLHTTLFEPGINDFFAKGGLRFLFRTPVWSAVWIFFILSGYLAGKGYASQCYVVTWEDTKRYYLRKILKVMIPTYVYIFIVLAILYPGFVSENPIIILKLITFTYDASPGNNGISATWYVFTLFWLYLITPIAAGVLNRLKKNPGALCGALGFITLASLIWRTYACFAGLEWNHYVFVPPVCNLDLYIGGMILAYLCAEKEPIVQSRSIRASAALLFAVLIITNCYVYNRALLGDMFCDRLCRYFYQTLYLMASLIYLYVFDNGKWESFKKCNNKLGCWAIKLINGFAAISFEFYLFHSLVLDKVAECVISARVINTWNHLQLLGYAGALSTVLAFGYHKIWEGKQIWSLEKKKKVLFSYHYTKNKVQSEHGSEQLNRAARKSNIEVLRIVCMVLLVAHHCVVHGGTMASQNAINQWISLPFIPIGKICFDAFVAISAWYTVGSQFKANRFVRIWLQILFYNLLFLASTELLGSGYAQEVTWRTWLGACFPVIGNSHGFAASYVIYYLCTPFLHYVTERLTKRKAELLVGILFLTQVFSTVLGSVTFYTQPMPSEILLFVLFYFSAFYLKRWPIKIERNMLALGLIIVGIWLGSTLVRYENMIHPDSRFYAVAVGLIGSEFSLSNIIAGFAVFLFFKNIEMPIMPKVNVIASLTFGILLYHDHNYFRPVVWGRLVHTYTWINAHPLSFVAHALLSVVAVFTLGAMIDFARQKLLEAPLMRTKIVIRVCGWLNGVIEQEAM